MQHLVFDDAIMSFDKPVGIWVMVVIATAFGLMTIKSGGSVLFIEGVVRQEAGNYVPFVLWFNFIAGFVYIIAAVGLWMQKHWAVKLSMAIVVAKLVVFAALWLHILDDGLYESHTVLAMSFRSAIWTLIAIFSYRKIISHR